MQRITTDKNVGCKNIAIVFKNEQKILKLVQFLMNY